MIWNNLALIYIISPLRQLNSYINQNKIDILSIQEVGEALNHMHSKGIMHGDVSKCRLYGFAMLDNKASKMFMWSNVYYPMWSKFTADYI